MPQLQGEDSHSGLGRCRNGVERSSRPGQSGPRQRAARQACARRQATLRRFAGSQTRGGGRGQTRGGGGDQTRGGGGDQGRRRPHEAVAGAAGSEDPRARNHGPQDVDGPPGCQAAGAKRNAVRLDTQPSHWRRRFADVRHCLADAATAATATVAAGRGTTVALAAVDGGRILVSAKRRARAASRTLALAARHPMRADLPGPLGRLSSAAR